MRASEAATWPQVTNTPTQVSYTYIPGLIMKAYGMWVFINYELMPENVSVQIIYFVTCNCVK